MVICLERSADLHMAQLMPLLLTVSCFSKSRLVLAFWYRPTRVWICADNYSVKLCGRCCSYQAALQAAFDSRVNIRKEVMELEVSERILALKIHKKELTLGRLSQLVDEADHCRVQ